MKRRRFIGSIGATLASLAASNKVFTATSSPQVAVTMDDPQTTGSGLFSAQQINSRILDALKSRRLKAALFVCGKRVDSDEGRRLVREWDDAGHIIANHSYSHHYYHSAKISFDVFAEDILRGEAVIKDYANFKKLFRYPYLKEGDTREKRDRARAFLKERGYRNGYVTIDASDWYVEDRMKKRVAAEPKARLSGYRDFYLSHIWERATFYNDLAKKVLGRDVRHTLLIHHNSLNALFLGELLDMFKSKGWQLVDVARAYEDPINSSAPDIVPAGESLVWALAKETGKYNHLLRYPGEDGPYEKEKMDRLGL
jgi:peptidoglycan-N-acetylglucosamine deacetylase